MPPMSVTLEVPHPETSSVASEEQPWNISSILMTFEVSQPETSSVASEEQ